MFFYYLYNLIYNIQPRGHLRNFCERSKRNSQIISNLINRNKLFKASKLAKCLLFLIFAYLPTHPDFNWRVLNFFRFYKVGKKFCEILLFLGGGAYCEKSYGEHLFLKLLVAAEVNLDCQNTKLEQKSNLIIISDIPMTRGH